MAKFITIFSILLLCFCELHAQFPYGTANITDGSVSCKTITTVNTTIDDKVVSKTISEASFSTSLKIAFYHNAEDIDQYDVKKHPNKDLPNIASGSNYVRTLNENETLATARIPRFPTQLSYSNKTWGTDPCDYSNDKAIMLTQVFGVGQVADEKRGVSVGITGIKGEKGFFIVKVFAGGGWGKITDLPLMGNEFRPDPDDEYKCKWLPIQGDNAYIMTGPQTSELFLGSTEIPELFEKVGPGYYRKIERPEDSQTEIITEYKLLKIDTAQILGYVRNKPAFKSFNMIGSYRQVVKNLASNEVTETIEVCTVTLNFGKYKNDLLLSTVDEEEYHVWLPESREANKDVLKVKAVLTSEDDEPTDTLYFSLSDVSNYPGNCTNFPKKQDGKSPDLRSDMRFSPKQSDTNVEFIDSCHLKTKSRVREATVDIEIDDFGAFGRVEVKAATKNVNGLSKYNNEVGLILPEDENNNFIADKWEKDVGVFERSLEPKDDSDRYPEYNDYDKGDGWSVFEEYRGFYTEADYLEKPDNVKRKGEFVRTDPNYKDVFVFDDTHTLFVTNFVPSNAAKLNWHTLNDKQVIHYSSTLINNSLMTNNELTQPLVDAMSKFDHRWVNYNTPEKYRLKKHYCIFMMYSDLITGTAKIGKTFSYTANPEKQTPIDQCEIIIFQQKSTFMDAIRQKCPAQMAIADKNTIGENMYVSTTIHEVGHALGIKHHSIGTAKFEDGSNVIPVTAAMRDEYNAESAEYVAYDDVVCACGVKSCAMRYTFIYFEEFSSGELLHNLQNSYCMKSQKYTDYLGVEHDADGCFNTISAK